MPSHVINIPKKENKWDTGEQPTKYTLDDVTQSNTTASTSITINSMLVWPRSQRKRSIEMSSKQIFFISISTQYWPIFDAIYCDIYTASLFVAVILFFIGFFFLFLLATGVQTDRRTFIFSSSRLANIWMHMWER